MHFQSRQQKEDILAAIQSAIEQVALAREKLKHIAAQHNGLKDLQICITQLGVLCGETKLFDTPSIWNVYEDALRMPAQIEMESGMQTNFANDNR